MLVSKNLGTSSLIHIGEMLDKFSKFEKYENDHDFEKLKNIWDIMGNAQCFVKKIRFCYFLEIFIK